MRQILTAGVTAWWLAALAAVGARAQALPLPPGAGFVWEQVGDAPLVSSRAFTFDAGGTLWANSPLQWLDLRGGPPGVWVVPAGPNPRPVGNGMLALGPHPVGGPPRADTVLVTLGATRRSTDSGHTWTPGEGSGDYALYALPAGHAHAGRLLVGAHPAFSDDRGATWSPPVVAPDFPFTVQAFLALPPPGGLPGAASGRDVAAPPGWPSGRIVAVGDGGVAILSDDGGESYTPASLFAPGRHGVSVTLVRRPDTHPLGAGPRLLAAGFGEASASSVWASDDGGATWTRVALLTEPGDGPGWPGVSGIHALSEAGEVDPGAGGRAVAVLGRGHLYQTADGGQTWALVGRAPEMVASGSSEASTFASSSAVDADGRLYVAVERLGPGRGWLWRTAAPFAVASSETPPAPPSGVSLSVRPNPSASGSATVTVTVASAQEVRVVVVDALGREVAVALTGTLGAGTHTAAVDAGLAPGVYVMRATAADGRVVATTRLTVSR